MTHAQPTTATEVSASVTLRQLATGYQISQAVYVAARLGLADLMTEGPKTAEELAQATSAHAPSLYRLLRVLTAFGVFDEDTPGRFALTSVGACLRTDSPDSQRDAVLMWGSENFWQTARDLLHCVQTGETAIQHLFGVASPFEYYQLHPDLGAMMNAGWAALAHGFPDEVAAAYDFTGARTLVDVGGNRGQVLAPILQAYPDLRGILYDLPRVIAAATPFLEAAGVADRCTLVGGNMFDEIPSGGDIYLLSRVIHDWDDARALAILRACRAAMRPQAVLLLVERALPQHLDHSPNVQVSVQGDLTMLIRAGGRERTDAEYAVLLAAAGFAFKAATITTSGYDIIEAAPADSVGGATSEGGSTSAPDAK